MAMAIRNLLLALVTKPYKRSCQQLRRLSCCKFTPPALDGDLCSDVVGVASSIDMAQIEAGDADNSYLLHKINNTHIDVGGGGGQMPIVVPLGPDEITILTDWINDGAECEPSEE